MTTTFDSFGLRPDLARGVAALGFTTPTPIQAEAIPLLLQGRDIIALARTGSGKTLAFGLPILSRLERGKTPQALIVAPTRELANQIADALISVQPKGPLRVMAIYGGVGLGPQESALQRGIDIVVGTPGRLKDLLNRGTLDLRAVKILVLDEADEMLDMGFRRDIEFLLDRLPGRKQTLIFSATMPETIEGIARTHLHDPAHVQLVKKDETPVEIAHYFVRLGLEERIETLVGILRGEDPERALIFVKMKHETKRLAEKLEKQAGIKAGYLNGNMSQNARNAMMQRFRDGDVKYLIATDVAARGIDVEGLSHVIHFAVPTVVETYVHRSGRTGRAGAMGQTITFVTPDAEADFKAIRKRVDVKPFPGLALGSSLAAATNRVEPEEPAPRGRHEGGHRDGNRARGTDPGRQPKEPRQPREPRQPKPEPAAPTAERGPKPQPREPRGEGGKRWTGVQDPQNAAWRRFKMALPAGHRHSPASYHQWLTKHTGLTDAAFRGVQINAEHATFEVAGANVDSLLAVLKLKGR